MKKVRNCDQCQETFFTNMDFCPKCSKELKTLEDATSETIERASMAKKM